MNKQIKTRITAMLRFLNIEDHIPAILKIFEVETSELLKKRREAVEGKIGMMLSNHTDLTEQNLSTESKWYHRGAKEAYQDVLSILSE